MSELVRVDGLQPALVKDAGGKRESLNESPREWSYFFPHQVWHGTIFIHAAKQTPC